MCNCGGRGKPWERPGGSADWLFTPANGSPPQKYYSEEEAKRAQAAYGGTYKYIGIGRP